MAKKMLIDASQPDETRVVLLENNRLEEVELESADRKQLKSNIYLARITRVEPSLQAAFVDYGGNRHGFLPFSEIHPDYYQIPVADREALLQEVAESLSKSQASKEKAAPAAKADADSSEDDGKGKTRRRVRRRSKGGAKADQAADTAAEGSDSPASDASNESGEAKKMPIFVVDNRPEDDAAAEENSADQEAAAEPAAGQDVNADAAVEAADAPAEIATEGSDKDKGPDSIAAAVSSDEELVAVAVDTGSDEPAAEEKPKRKRRTRKKAEPEAEATEEKAAAETSSEAPAEAAGETAPAADSEEKPKRKRRVRKKKSDDTPAEDAAAEIAPEAAADAEPAAEVSEEAASAEDESAPKKRRSRRKATAKSEAEDDSSETPEAAEAEEDDDAADNDNSSDDDDDDSEYRAIMRSILARRYKIQEVIKKRQVMLVQVTKEERGNKGAALTTYLSLAGRYCVLMPNTARGGGISRKIASAKDRKRLKTIVDGLDISPGISVIVRTAGSERTKPEIKRDYDYLARTWNTVRETTLSSAAPALIYEEGNVLKRAVRDLYTNDTDEIIVEGEAGYKATRDLMKALTPSHVKRVKQHPEGSVPLFIQQDVESSLEDLQNHVVQLPSGGYIVINQTEALVAIDVNSGKAIRERHIEDTATKTNLEAAEEIGRQLRLRDMAGLVVVDFIDMEENRNVSQVERRMREAMKGDRARVQIGRISSFGLLELSRQRLRPSVMESTRTQCATCEGTGMVRSAETIALSVLRAVEERMQGKDADRVIISVSADIAVAMLNNRRARVAAMEARMGLTLVVQIDPALDRDGFDLFIEDEKYGLIPVLADEKKSENRNRRSRGRGGRSAESSSDDGNRDGDKDSGEKRTRNRRPAKKDPEPEEQPAAETPASAEDDDEDANARKRRRGKRGGRRRKKGDEGSDAEAVDPSEAPQPDLTAAPADAEAAEADNAPEGDKAEAITEDATVDVSDGSEADKQNASPDQAEASAEPEAVTAEAPAAEAAAEEEEAETAAEPEAPAEPEKPKKKRSGWWSRG